MRLLLDVMCGRLVPYLRMCGHDAAYAGDRGLEDDDALLAVAADEDRTVLTRDVELAGRADRAILLETTEFESQLRSLREEGIELALADEPGFCGACNGRLEPVDRTTPTPEYAPDATEESVWRCRDCGQHFWRGSHWGRVRETLASLDTDA